MSGIKPENQNQLDVTVDEYRVTFNPEKGLVAHRNGFKWRDLHGDNLVYSLAAEVDSLRKQLAEMKEVFELVQEERHIQLAEDVERGQISLYLREYRKKLEVGNIPILVALIDDILQFMESRGEIIELSLSETKDMAARYEAALKLITTYDVFKGSQMHAAAIRALGDRVDQRNYLSDEEEKTSGGIPEGASEGDGAWGSDNLSKIATQEIPHQSSWEEGYE